MSLDVDGDDLAGIVDMFDGLTREELDEALGELAYRRGEDPPAEDAVEAALASYELVTFERESDADLLVAGPVAFPTLPDGATDLPHILDVESRRVDRDSVAEAVERRFRGDVAGAVADGDEARMRELLDVSYELEAWGPVDLGGMRERLDDALAE